MKKHAAPIVAAILLLLPVLYVGSYLALVVPGGIAERGTGRFSGVISFDKHYRFANTEAKFIYWPLEQIDRKVRPGAWEPTLKLGPQFHSIYDPAIHN
jgi:hypothetical protein